MRRAGGLQGAAECVLDALAGIQSRLIGRKVNADSGRLAATRGRADPDDLAGDRNASRIVQQRQDQVHIVAQLVRARGRNEHAAAFQVRHVRGVQRGLFLDRQRQNSRARAARCCSLSISALAAVVHLAVVTPCGRIASA